MNSVDDKLREIVMQAFVVGLDVGTLPYKTSDEHYEPSAEVAQIKQTLRDLIKDRLPKKKKPLSFPDGFVNGYNQCLEDVTAILEEIL